MVKHGIQSHGAVAAPEGAHERRVAAVKRTPHRVEVANAHAALDLCVGVLAVRVADDIAQQ